ncbi:hypothetical protein [Mycolicibacterium sp. P9-22]|uniref:hypothetical protein n=1 Tax=Mycolicibacterium sp. P9-22 TaxID=2024613 RepID=UPI0018838F29|nr:hypothetical protein [Mycolicibacterium sp. P9-22]
MRVLLLSPRSVAVKPVVAPAVPVVVELAAVQQVVAQQAELAAVVRPAPVVVELQVQVVALLVQSAVAVRPVELVAVPVVWQAVALPAVARFPSELWSKAAALAVPPWNLPWLRPPLRWPYRRSRWLRLRSRSRCPRSRWPRPRWKWRHLRSRFTRRRFRWPGPQPRFPYRTSTSRYPISAFRASVCPVVSESPAEWSAVHLVPWSVVLPPLWSLTQEPRPLRPVLLSSRLRHPRSRVARLAEGPRVVAPQVAPVRRAEVPVRAVPEQVALVRAVPVRVAPVLVALVRAVPEQMRVLSVAVPRRPVVQVAEPPSEVVRRAALRRPVVPGVAHPSAVVHPSVVAPRSQVAHLPERPWWTRPVSLRVLRWWTRRWSDR